MTHLGNKRAILLRCEAPFSFTSVVGCGPRLRTKPMKRREFIKVVGSAAVAWSLTARAQQPAMPVIAFLSGRSADVSVRVAAAFRKGLNDS
jgi:hypothetical protein